MSVHDVDTLARGLPRHQPEADRVQRVRDALVATVDGSAVAPQTPGRRRVAIAVGIGLVLAAAVALAWRAGDDRGPSKTPAVAQPEPEPSPTREPAPSVRVTARDAATYQRTTADGAERIALRDGTLSIEADRAAAVVVAADGAVEVRASTATFDVGAADDRLAAVIVFDGRVEILSSSSGTTVIEAGGSWHAPLPASTEPAREDLTPSQKSRPTQRPTPAPVPTPAPEVAPAPPAPGEAEFRAGWTALQANDPTEAAVQFAAARRAAPRGGVAEDAHFWEGIARAKAGQSAAAIKTLRSFLRAYPSSARAGQARVRLGWLLVDAGDLDGAEAQFQAAADDAVPKVAESAKKGLAAVAKQRAE